MEGQVMVSLESKAKMTCEKPGCLASAPVLLCLTVAGTFAFKPLVQGWQVRAPNGPTGPFATLCPEHRITVEPVQGVIQEAR
jgi:hypothetical protein